METLAEQTFGALHARYVLSPWSVAGNAALPVVVRGEGCRLFTDDGRSFIDFSAGLVAVNLGHGHPALASAIAEQAARLTFAPPSMANDRRAELAEAIVRIAPWNGRGRVFFTTGGGEANEDAVKMARTITGRHKVLTAYRSFHGSAPGAGTLSGENRRWPNEPGMPGVVRFFAPFPYRSPFHTRDARVECERALAHLEEIVTYEGGDRIAALLIEPVVGSNGVIVYPDGYLAGVRDLCDRHGIVLVFDEVMTGFGRTGAPFAAQRFGVVPDALTFAKGVTSAYVPLGGVVLREELAAYFDTHALPCGHTFSGHPLAMAAGVAALHAYESDAIFSRVSHVEATLRRHLEPLARRHPCVGEVRGTGAFFGIELVRDRDTREPLVPWQGNATLARFTAGLLERGVYAFGRYNVLVVAPPLIVDDAEIAEAVAVLDDALEALS